MLQALAALSAISFRVAGGNAKVQAGKANEPEAENNDGERSYS